MFSIRNLEKFLDAHPELGLDTEQIKIQAQGLAHNNILSGQYGQVLLGNDIASIFFHEITTIPAHLAMFQEDIIAAGLNF